MGVCVSLFLIISRFCFLGFFFFVRLVFCFLTGLVVNHIKLYFRDFFSLFIFYCLYFSTFSDLCKSNVKLRFNYHFLIVVIRL